MRIQHFILSAAALVAIFAISCSKSRSDQTADGHGLRRLSQLPANMTTKELGVVEFSAHTPKSFTLGPGTNCVITPTILPDSILKLHIAVETKDADGKASQMGQGEVTQRSGQQCGISVGDMMISLTPKLKVE
ncbi:MAG: hypothetical protein U1F98_12220 [Verrucomicrobiota bacterium]